MINRNRFLQDGFAPRNCQSLQPFQLGLSVPEAVFSKPYDRESLAS